MEEGNVTFLNRSECCERFSIEESDDNIKIIEEIISTVPLNSVVLNSWVRLNSVVGFFLTSERVMNFEKNLKKSDTLNY